MYAARPKMEVFNANSQTIVTFFSFFLLTAFEIHFPFTGVDYLRHDQSLGTQSTCES